MQNMKKLGLWLVMVLTAATAMAATPGELTVEPPTLHCAGFHWEVADDDNNNATANIEFRKAGAGEWKKGLDFMRLEADGRQWVAGSLFDLEPGTDYEAKITLVDPDGVGGEATQTVTFKTRTEPVKPEGGKIYHVYPEGADGGETPLLGEDGDWRAALADPATLQPGDRVKFHTGEYSLSPNIEKVATKDVSEVSTADLPTMPEDGTVWHVYPPKYKGEVQEPMLGKKRSSYWAYEFHQGGTKNNMKLKPGDTVLVHAGEYKIKRPDYRDKIFQAPRWGVWRVWTGGTAERPIRVKAAGDGEVVFDGDGSYALFELTGSGNIWFDGITIRNTHCGFIGGQEPYGSCEGLTVTNCTFENVAMPIYNDGEMKDWHIAGNTGLDKVHVGPWHEAFGTIKVAAQGSFEKPIMLETAGDGDVTFIGNENYTVFDVVTGRNIWFDNLNISKSECAILAGYCPFMSTTGLIVTNCKATDVRNAIYDDEAKGSENYYIADNEFVGRNRISMNDHSSPFGVFIAGKGHVVCYNTINQFQDAVNTSWDRIESIAEDDYTASYDMHNNLLLSGPDDWIEMDNGMFNIRAYENMMLNAGAHALSMQGGPGGPYYWIRNVAYKKGSSPFKLPRNMFAYHNLITSDNAGMNKFGGNLHLRNNIFMPYKGQFKERDYGKEMLIAFQEGVPANTSDYNAYYKTSDVFSDKPFGLTRGKKPTFSTLEEFSEATGLEKHGIFVDGWSIFQKAGPPEGGRDDILMTDDLDLRLKEDAPVVDAGIVLPNINDDYNGDAPDLGPYEVGKPMPHYGPRK